MAEDQHTDDLRNVNEGDSLHIHTSEGENFSAECQDVLVQNADPRSGEIRETTIWLFETPKGRLSASILEGLKSSPDDPDFPQHSALYSMDTDGTLGYIESVEIHGKMEA